MFSESVVTFAEIKQTCGLEDYICERIFEKSLFSRGGKYRDGRNGRDGGRT